MLDGDAGDFCESLGQRFGFVLVGGDRFRHHRNFLDAFGLQFFSGLNEPFHLCHLLVFGQGRWLELVVHPFFRFCFTGPGTLAQDQRCCCEGDCTVFQFHARLLKNSPCFERTRVLGKLQTVSRIGLASPCASQEPATPRLLRSPTKWRAPRLIRTKSTFHRPNQQTSGANTLRPTDQ